MRTVTKVRLLSAALAAMPVLFVAERARAQFRVGEDGHALDASNRVGSGGVNDVTNRTGTVNGNDLVIGNVTGGRQFRGGVDYGDPLQFRQNLPGRGVDAFLRDSSGVPTPYSPQFSLNDPRPFYGSSRGVAPPVGTVQMQFTGAYVGTDLTPPNPYASSLLTSQNSIINNTRLGDTNIVGYEQSSATNVLALPGSLDSSAPDIQSVLTATPLTGVVRLNASQPGDRYFLDRYLATRRNGEGVPTTIDDATVQQLRRELQPEASPDQTLPLPGVQQPNALLPGTNQQSNNGQSTDENSDQANPRDQRPNALGAARISGNPNGSSTSDANRPIGDPISQQPLGASGYQEGQRQRLLVPPARQSTQYDALQKRYEQFSSEHPQTDEEANRAFRRDLRNLQLRNGKRNNGAATTRPATGIGPGTRPSGVNQTPVNQPVNPNPRSDVAPQPNNAPPVKITSLAAGIKAKGLHDLMASAEDLMRADKFASAIQKYNDAERVAPNNPLIALGRAHAELGAAYYGKAEADLRRVVTLDPELLMGQFDLSSVMNAQRLSFIQKDLKDLSRSEPKSERPWFLLAYIAYNTGDVAAATGYLDEARQRTSSTDRVIPMMRSHWQLAPTAHEPAPLEPPPAKPELNK